MTRRVQIVGAGPAGLAAAITLARAGAAVTIHDRHPDAGQRFHGDFQGLENWSTELDVTDWLTSFGLRTDFLAAPFRGGRFASPNGTIREIETDRPLFYLVLRGPDPESLDRGMKRQAVEAGARFEWNSVVEQATGDVVISATGPKAADILAKGIVFRTSSAGTCLGLLDDDLAPKGYAYLLVHGGRGTIASCMFEDFRNERLYFARTYERILELTGIDVEEPREFGGYGNFYFNDTLEKRVNGRRVLYIGENGGFQDALWGFGLRYAIFSGVLAARSILDELPYEELCHKTLIPRMKTSLMNRWLFARLGNAGYDLWLEKFLGTGDVIRSLRKHYAPSRVKDLLAPVARKSFETRLMDKRCMHEGCTCLWCRHGDHTGGDPCSNTAGGGSHDERSE